MPVDVDIEVDIPDNQDEIVQELLGLKKLTWTDTSFKENTQEITTSLRVSIAHIMESRNTHKKLSSDEQKLKKALETELSAAGLSEESSYALYKFALARCEVLNTIVVYTTLQTKVLVDSINEMNRLLNRAYEYGAVRQKVENELELLKESKELLKDVVTAMLKDRVESQNQYFKSLENFQKQIVDMTREVNNLPVPVRKDVNDSKNMDERQKLLNDCAARDKRIFDLEKQLLNGSSVNAGTQQVKREATPPECNETNGNTEGCMSPKNLGG